MKKIEAIIKPSKLDEVKNALDEIGIEEMTLSEVKAFSRQKTHTEVYRGINFAVDCRPEIKIELALPDHQLDAALHAIVNATKTAGPGESRIFVSHIDEVFRRANTMEKQAA